MNVREATLADVPALRRIARASWERDEVLTRETATETVEEWYDESRLAADVESPGVLVLAAAMRDAVIGFAHAVVHGDTGTVLRLYVEPDRRRTGVGTQLLEATCEELAARGVERVQAMTLAANDPGTAFYEANGFERTSKGTTTIGGESYPEHVYTRPV
ncbi:GNAT family N-acetyltransferase [Halomarina ordinaria]|uniref:GNAT family N-acetyltransferase n=1 Tax=Halomarina ordinaria TaxID=3033939 RepID=A0ABD5U9Y7_9EURY|nr:GNAT family N-acetyltransferase [Halomarina sp. PSRA2]